MNCYTLDLIKGDKYLTVNYTKSKYINIPEEVTPLNLNEPR